jgi:hypothetical protein
MEEEIVKEVSNFPHYLYILFSIILGGGIGIIYSRFFIKYQLKKKLPPPIEAFRIISWLNIIFGVFFSSIMNLSLGITVLYYRMVVIPQIIGKK